VKKTVTTGLYHRPKGPYTVKSKHSERLKIEENQGHRVCPEWTLNHQSMSKSIFRVYKKPARLEKSMYGTGKERANLQWNFINTYYINSNVRVEDRESCRVFGLKLRIEGRRRKDGRQNGSQPNQRIVNGGKLEESKATSSKNSTSTFFKSTVNCCSTAAPKRGNEQKSFQATALRMPRFPESGSEELEKRKKKKDRVGKPVTKGKRKPPSDRRSVVSRCEKKIDSTGARLNKFLGERVECSASSKKLRSLGKSNRSISG